MIVVCGEALIDMVVAGDGSRQPTPGGGPLNTASGLARLGIPTAFLGHFSTDEFGHLLSGRLAADGASLALASFGPEPTTVAVANLDDRGLAEYDFSVDGTSAPNLRLDMLPAELPAEVNALHVGTLGLALEPMASTLVELVRRESSRRLVMLDPNIRPLLASGAQYRARLDWLISQSAVVKASAEDLAWIYPGLDHRAAAQRILACGVGLVLVTLGEAGAYGISGDARASVGAEPVQVVDTIGAGDEFGAATLAWLYDHDRLRPDLRLSEGELEGLLRFATLAAALICTRAGADPPWRSELAGYIPDPPDLPVS